jgi:hypothetical protein
MTAKSAGLTPELIETYSPLLAHAPREGHVVEVEAVHHVEVAAGAPASR